MIQGIRNKNMYLVLIDRTSTDGTSKELYQLEIEAIETSPSSEKEIEIVEDIAAVAKYALKKFPFLKPTTLTKQKWLLDQRKNLKLFS